MTAADIARVDVPAERLAADVAALVERQRQQRAAELDRLCEETRANGRSANPDPDGAHLDQWHEFLDIDPDLRGRDYTTGGTA